MSKHDAAVHVKSRPEDHGINITEKKKEAFDNLKASLFDLEDTSGLQINVVSCGKKGLNGKIFVKNPPQL